MPGPPRACRSTTREPPHQIRARTISLAPHAFASRSSAMPFPRLASDASGPSCPVLGFLPCQARPRCLDCLRRSVLVRHHRGELSSSQKNAYHFDKVLISEPLSKLSTGPSRQSLCMKIDSHSCASFLALTRIIHSPTRKPLLDFSR